MKQEVSPKVAAIIIGIIVVLLAGFGIYKWRSSTPVANPTAPEASQTYQQMQQDYGGTRGMRPPPGSAGGPR